MRYSRRMVRPAPSRRGNGDESGVDGGMELTNDVLDDILLV